MDLHLDSVWDSTWTRGLSLQMGLNLAPASESIWRRVQGEQKSGKLVQICKLGSPRVFRPHASKESHPTVPKGPTMSYPQSRKGRPSCSQGFPRNPGLKAAYFAPLVPIGPRSPQIAPDDQKHARILKQPHAIK